MPEGPGIGRVEAKRRALTTPKLRWADRRRGKGKRGGLRVIYYYLMTDAQIWLMTLYDKGEVADLSAAEKRLLRAALDAELARRATRQRPRRK